MEGIQSVTDWPGYASIQYPIKLGKICLMQGGWNYFAGTAIPRILPLWKENIATHRKCCSAMSLVLFSFLLFFYQCTHVLLGKSSLNAKDLYFPCCIILS